jgi:hypothetical protein
MAGREAPGEVAGRRGRALTPRADNEAALAQIFQRILECAEVLGEQQVDRPAVATDGADPALENLRAGALRRLLGQREQDRQLRLVVELAAEDAERIGVEDRQQLVVGEPEPVLQQRGGGGGQKSSWFSPPAAASRRRSRIRTAGSRRRRPRTPSRR